MTYPRKGTVTLAQAKSLLSIDPLFSTLADAVKTVFINTAVQKVCSLRNRENKIDYVAYTSSGDAATPEALTSGEVLKGTTVERIAHGLTLTLTSQVIWIDTTANTVYGWNGTEWV